MDKGMIFVPLVGRSAAFVAYWTLRLFFSSTCKAFNKKLTVSVCRCRRR